MKRHRAILATLGIVAVLVPAAIWAAGPHGHEGMGAGPFGMGGGNVLHLADKLGLTTDQITQIKGILSAARTANAPTRAQLKTNQQAFEAAYNPAQFDATSVNAYIAQQTPLRQQLAVGGFQTEANVLAVLTPSQLTQYKQLKAEMQQWRQSNPGRS